LRGIRPPFRCRSCLPQATYSAQTCVRMRR
jgi:hypothetical protein